MKRRLILATPLMIAAGPALIQPQSAADQDQARVDIGQGFRCPALRARVLGLLPLRGIAVTQVAFGADSLNCSADFLALLGPDGRLLALDILSLTQQHAPQTTTNTTTSITTRIAAMADHRHISLERNGAHHATATRWRREAWTDYWRWTGSALENAPARQVLEGTWQDAFRQRRISLAQRLAKPSFAITPDLLAEATAPLRLLG